MTKPHKHNQDRYVTVIEGTWHVGMTKSFEPENTIALEKGSYMVHPKGEIHYDGARDERVIVEIRGMGPVSTDFIQK